MLTLTLIAALHGASLPNVRHSASLTGESPAIGTGMLLAQSEAPPPPPGDSGGLGLARPARSLQELRDERTRLDATRPSLGGPIAMLAVGAGLALVGAGVGLGGLELLIAYFFTTGLYGGSSIATVFTVAGFVLLGIGVVMLGVGIPLAIIGGIRLKKTINERTAIGVEMNLIDDQIKALEDNVPPPAPMPTSVERNQGPQPLLVLSSF